MKTLINQSLQSLQVCILNPGQNSFVRIQPRQRVLIKDEQLSQMAINLANRRLIKIVNAADPAAEFAKNSKK